MSATSNILMIIGLYTVVAFIANYYFAWWKVILIWNVITGYTTLHMVWKLVPRYIVPNEERDSLFPAFRRLDSHNWNFWMFVPGAVTVFPLRAIISCSSLVAIMFWCKILLIGHRIGKEPIIGWRQKAIQFVYQKFVRIIIFMSNVGMKKHVVDYDYSEYLGKDYLKT